MARKKTNVEEQYPSLERKSIEDMTPRERPLSQIVEFQVHVAPRGRSVLIGTVIEEGKLQSVKHELSHEEKISFMDVVAHALNLQGH
jgi:hypothetical protein